MRAALQAVKNGGHVSESGQHSGLIASGGAGSVAVRDKRGRANRRGAGRGLAVSGKSHAPRSVPDLMENGILARLSEADLELLTPHLEAVDLPLRTQLQSRNRRIDYAYFLQRGFASVVAYDERERGVEVGLIGREGMAGVALILDADRSPYETFMQNAGAGFRIKAGDLREAVDHSATLRALLLRYGQALFIQTAYTALAYGRSKLEERLARWLLMAYDRVDGDEVAVTHEFLAMMLGVRRPGVTVALKLLENSGLIQRDRQSIRIVDRNGLMLSTNGAYGTAEAEFRRLFGDEP
jgi:CRP-like cAMP-binding protein